MKKTYLFLLVFSALHTAFSQTYTSYFTGDTADVNTATQGGICIMGGATENDNAMRWFLARSGGGDIVVIRATGSDGYNDYLYSQLGVSVNSVQTIVMPTLASAQDPYIAQQIRNAEALWIAGGDQWDYVSAWKNQPVGAAIQYLIEEKKVPIGGTSAGMAIQGAAYFDAQNGTVTSAEALANPFNPKVSLGYGDFLQHPVLQNCITDTHFDNPDRKGRLMVFMARLAQDQNINLRAIACEEYTAVCIDTQGIARVFGDPGQDFAYFLQINCVQPNGPETCAPGQALHWYRDKAAVKAYRLKGTQNGITTFDLNDWKTGSGGAWQNWWVDNGALQTASSTPPDCASVLTPSILDKNLFRFFPNPAKGQASLELAPALGHTQVSIRDVLGKTYFEGKNMTDTTIIPLAGMSGGLFFLQLQSAQGTVSLPFVVL